ncbi:hypothetical protein KKF91_17650 [Myxococcota bacterium]|nr:hypothetical protein [Myxococcota bacterium]MBU1432367.1 hypothetical protein [Myxococcota bacterium]MBU1899435.1 hypothetical protein [Myxococcota bacterium]
MSAKVFLLMAPLALGCGELDPEVGATRADLNGQACALTPSGEAVSYARVQAEIFDQRCGCHTVPGGFGQTLGGLDLSSYEALMRGSRNADEGALIAPGDPCQSLLLQKLQDPPPFGARMPFNTTRLDAASLQLIVDWIADGARGAP